MSLTDDQNKTIEEKVKKMVDDMGKGLATKSEFIDGMKKAIGFEHEKMEATETTLKETQGQVVDLEKELILMRKQLKSLIATGMSSSRSYKGFLSIEEAKNFGLFAMSIAGNKKARTALEKSGIEVKAMGDGNESGNFLVPDDFYNSLIVMMDRCGVYRSDARPWPMSRDNGSAPILTKGGSVYCPGAGVAATPSDLTFGMVQLNALKLLVYMLINNELDEDAAIAIGPIVAQDMIRAFTRTEDKNGFMGDGTASYFGTVGIIQSIYRVNTTVADNKGLHVQGTPGAWSDIAMSDILSLLGMLPDFAEEGNNANFYCNKNFYYTVLLNLALSLGGANATEAIVGLTGREPVFMGHKVKFVSSMPKVKPAADHCPLLLGDLSLTCYLGDRREVTIEQSKEAAFANDQTAVRGSERIAQAVFGHKTVDEDGNNAAGATVGLWADIG